ncbi:hypothetical protein F4823DRAFT_613981 [Ustulina deusta]|nr:hypothetical protein F4823DRAFT_613981 [Ustulina deusta]
MLRQCSAYLHFSDPAHFVAWAVLCGTLATFTLVHLRFIDFHGVFCRDGGRVPGEGALPGECFYFLRSTATQYSVRSHLVLALPAALLACTQFVPRIRHKAIFLHRLNGYVSLVLGIFGAVGIVPSIRHAFGGDVAAQAAGGTMTVLFVGAQLKAYVSVRRRQIDQHQAWMIRSWVYASAIISLRIIMFIAAIIVSVLGDYYMAQPCDKIDFILGHDKNKVLARYPDCGPFYTGQDPKKHVAVNANIGSKTDITQVVTAFNATYGMSSWVAFMIHAAGVEIYFNSVASRNHHNNSEVLQKQQDKAD